LLAVAASSGLSGSLTVQDERDGVTIADLAATLPLPCAATSTTAALQRIVMAPGATLERDYRGPVLFFIERGTVLVDLDRHQLAIVQSGGGSDGRMDRGVSRGKIPAGYGNYSADGSLGPMQTSVRLNSSSSRFCSCRSRQGSRSIVEAVR
jgi:hypothetical protein